MRIEFEVFANPLPKQSFKMGRGGGYTPQATKDYQELVSWMAKKCLADMGHKPMQGNISVELYFWRGNKRKVDLDNLSKCVLDAMNGVIYEDDRQITALHLFKAYDKENPRLKVVVEPIRDTPEQENLGGASD